ncbi:c-type cytochrome [Prosthecomicrobium sp. N25]|uniref:c-type cytochrome n=1 Tax=Prosthecomicrobium sp. N25 TaxID=3129254 RepID=UPI003077DA5E
MARHPTRRGAAILILGGFALASPPAAAQPAGGFGDAGRGRAVVERVACGVCHRIPGVAGARGIVGPPLDGFAARPLLAGQLPNRPETVARFVEDPPALVPATGMPRIGLSGEEARDVAAFLGTLK